MIIEFNTAGNFTKQPDIGSITGTTKVEVTWDDAWTGNEKCLRLIDGNVVFDLKADYNNNRLKAYPTLSEQADMQYWDAINGTTTWQDAITAVKAEFPKTTGV